MIKLATLLAGDAEREQVGCRLVSSPVVLLLKALLFFMVFVHVRHKVDLMLHVRRL